MTLMCITCSLLAIGSSSAAGGSNIGPNRNRPIGVLAIGKYFLHRSVRCRPCFGLVFWAACLAVSLGTLAEAASINYGNFGIPPAGIMFIGVTESSGTDAVPLYGPPDPFAVGLDFDPINFVATSAGGGTDLTDGQLNFTIMGIANPNGAVGVKTVGLFEAGDYTLAGAGTPATSASAGAITRATVTQINGLPVAPISLIPSNASISFALPGAAIVQPWSLGTTLNVGAQLAGLGFGPNDLATKVEIVINNSLVTTSELNTASFIAKKDFRIDLTPDTVGHPFIPEPNSLVLALLFGGGQFILSSRRR